MKILHVGPKNYPPAHGGVEKVVYDIITESKDYQSHVLVEWLQPENNLVKVLPTNFLRRIRFILAYISNENIDIIHFHKEAFVPYAIIASLMRKKTLITFHGCAWRIKRWAWHYRVAFYLLDILACIFVSRVIFVGQEDFRHFSRLIFWRKMFYIPNGIENNSFLCTRDTRKCVFIGRISPEKNILKLIEMFAKGDKKLTIYGPFDKHDQSYQTKILTAINATPNVNYGGVLQHTQILSTLVQFNTFYNISFSEGMPVSVLEAASVGLNLVLSNIPQHIDLNFPDTVYINPYHPVDNFSFKSNSRMNKSHVESNFSLLQTINMYQSLYKQLIIK